MAGMMAKRLGKELAKLQQSTPKGITIVSADDFKEWKMDVQVLGNPLYDPEEKYRLKMTFPSGYPIEPPEVVFMLLSEPPRRIPIHPHIYSNGIICLDLLDKQGWSPVQNVESICLSLQSMLDSNTKNEREWTSPGYSILGEVEVLTVMNCRTTRGCRVREAQPTTAARHQLPIPRSECLRRGQA